MNENISTALVCLFARYYHNENNKIKIYSDIYAKKILTKEEYENIAKNMINGIKFFNNNFVGNDKEALDYIINRQLSPSLLGRSIFVEKILDNEINLGCKEYLIYASGYDTSGYKNKYKNIKVFEIDKNEMIEDKIKRIQNANIENTNVNYIKCDFTNDSWINNIIESNYKKEYKSLSSLMGISYYLTKQEFSKMIKEISKNISNGSGIIFDYPNYESSIETTNNELLASGLNEIMKSKYTYKEIEKILEDSNLYIYEHLNNKEITNQFFYDYNTINPNNKIIAPKGVAYCYAVKK